LSAQEIDSTQVRKGKKIFNANCASCHKLEGKLIGPALGKVEERRTNEWLKAWIKNNAELRASGDADAIAIFNEYNGSYDALMSVGLDEGYQPIQPIAFSHKIHAGENKVDCQYCHSSAKHSKHSGIPSLNVCMNCHKSIAEVAETTQVMIGEDKLGKAELDLEIQKLYDAIGWDKEELVYKENYEQKPVKWIRIHNLPDFAYFNHSQHVTAGGIKCQQCHGPVEEMDELYQYSPLTMGWCINCHRETEIDLKGNEYYAKIHEELSKKYGVEKVTVAQMGGMECGKCHY